MIVWYPFFTEDAVSKVDVVILLRRWDGLRKYESGVKIAFGLIVENVVEEEFMGVGTQVAYVCRNAH